MVTGWVVGTSSSYSGPVKGIIGVVEGDYLPDQRYLDFARQVANHFLISLGMVLDYSLSPRAKGIRNLSLDLNGKGKKIAHFSLSHMQAMAAGKPMQLRVKSREAPPGRELSAATTGIKGSHDSRVMLGHQRLDKYSDIVATYLGRGQSVLIVVPDILTARYLATYLPDADLYHSESRIGEREAIWQKYQQGVAGAVIGGLTAAFLPIHNLGCIIQERTQKQFSRSAYTAILPGEVADIRASSFRVPTIWGSDSYSVKMYHQKGGLEVDDLRQAEKASLQVERIKPGEKGIPRRVLEILRAEFQAGKKVLVVVNKRVSTEFLFCTSCNRTQRCPACRSPLVLSPEGATRCQKCARTVKESTVCPRCNTPISVIHDLSMAVLKDAVAKHIVEVGVCTLTADEIKSIDKTLATIGEANVVIATPAIINPFFKNFFEVIIYLKPESAFNMNQYHAAEMIFSTIGELREMIRKGGQIYLFSTFHFHYAIRFADDEEAFFARELKYRQWFSLPPYARVYQVEIKDKDLRMLAGKMRDLYHSLGQTATVSRLYLLSRQPSRGFFKGALEVHGHGNEILAAGVMSRRDITVSLLTG
jgi:primosomal protein N'